MGRRSVLSNMPKMVLPSVSWVAVMRLLRKAPRNLPTLAPGLGAEMAMKALMGCGAAPQTDSLRYTDDYLARVKGPHCSRGKRPKPAVRLPIMGGCSSRPHTDSFRVHHVVNQEALQLMLTFGDDHDADSDHEAFFESEELWYGVIRDGDRLLHDDIYADDSARASCSMRTCSSSLSAAASSSLTSSACTALSRNSVDSEGLYSTAASASFSHASSCTAELLSAGPHISCDSRPSSSIIGSRAASEFVYSDVNLDHDLKLEAGEEAELLAKEEVQLGARHVVEYGVHATVWQSAGEKLQEYDDEAALRESYEGDAEDEEAEEEEIVAEMRYSEDPLKDFAEAISRMVVSQQLNKAAQLQELYWRFLRINAPSHHDTITLAFLHALQRLASFEPHLLHTLL